MNKNAAERKNNTADISIKIRLALPCGIRNDINKRTTGPNTTPNTTKPI
jgi:hypothetical protein